MLRSVCRCLALLAPLGAAAPAWAIGSILVLDPGATFFKYSHNVNDGYATGRGMVFRADESIIVDGAAFFNEDDEGLFATFALYSVVSTSGDVLSGATLLRSVTSVIAVGPVEYYGVKFPPLQLAAGQHYLLRISYPDISEQNWFYDFDPVVFGSTPVDIGPVTLIDGEAEGNTSNFVAPPLALQLYPCPADCGTIDGSVGVVDFLALLGQWGLVGAPCDLDGGGIGVTDFLLLLQSWGPCPVSDGTCTPQFCGTYVPGCDAGNDLCVCTETSFGEGFCLPGTTPCGSLLCPIGVCPPGYVCVVDTCCPDNICIPITASCTVLAEPPAGTPTIMGPAPGPGGK
jgi:hypothetical protein